MIPLQITGKGVSQEKPESIAVTSLCLPPLKCHLGGYSAWWTELYFFLVSQAKHSRKQSWGVSHDGTFCSWETVIKHVRVLTVAEVCLIFGIWINSQTYHKARRGQPSLQDGLVI